MDVNLSKRAAAFYVFFMLTSMGNANQIGLFVSGGPDFSTIKNNPLVEINEQVTNAYHSNTHTNWRGFWALGANHTFNSTLLPSYQFTLGMAGYFFQLGRVEGTEFPFINAGLFDTLHYSFRAKSASLMAEAKAVYSPYAFKPYVLIGVGSGWNKFYAYSEEPSDPSLSASPAMPFNNNTKQAFSYELGAGIQYLFLNDLRRHAQYYASVGYQYFNLGKGALGHSGVQTSSDRIKVNNLHTQGILFTLAVSLG